MQASCIVHMHKANLMFYIYEELGNTNSIVSPNHTKDEIMQTKPFLSRSVNINRKIIPFFAASWYFSKLLAMLQALKIILNSGHAP